MNIKIFQTNLMVGVVGVCLSFFIPFVGIAEIVSICVAVVAVVLLSAVLAKHTTQHLLAPLRDPERLTEKDVCVELQPMVRRITEQNRQNRKMIQKQVTELKREYEKQDRMRRDFTANVSHELKTPLTSISGYAEIIREGLVKTEDISRFAGRIYEEAQRLINLVGDILKLSQLEDGHQVQMERVPIDLYATCERIKLQLQASAEQHKVEVSLSGEHGEILGAEKVIDEIVYNLCDNAIKYNEEGGRVEICVREREKEVVLCVKDSGIGISDGELSRVFERFYRVDKSHSKEIGGTGLGLSIVKHGAAYHDAKIELESKLEEGTEIRIRFQKAIPS
ncbi:MAG: ATP-binding protein [Evtepia sp.]